MNPEAVVSAHDWQPEAVVSSAGFSRSSRAFSVDRTRCSRLLPAGDEDSNQLQLIGMGVGVPPTPHPPRPPQDPPQPIPFLPAVTARPNALIFS